MAEGSYNIRLREESLKRRWEGVADHVPVNQTQYSFDSPERELAFQRAQFPTEEEWKRYQDYREEWYRRAKEFDPGDYPLAVICELVSSCDLDCPMCYTRTEEFQYSVVGAQRILPYEIVCRVIDECADLGVPSMLFSWRGESTLYRSHFEGEVKRLPDVFAYARKRGILEITLLTNGQGLDARMARAIVEAEPSWINFSVDGLSEVYNKVRTPRRYKRKKGINYNAFEVVIDNIKQLVAIRDGAGKTRPQIRTNTIFPAIATEPQAYHDFMESIGVGWVTVNELLDFRGKELPEDAIRKDWACQYPFQRLTVSANGVIVPCTGAHNEERELVLGRYSGSPPKRVRNKDGVWETLDIPERTLYGAWHSPELKWIRQLHKEGRRVEIEPGCRNCRHGAKTHGVEWIPPDWDMERMEWKGEVGRYRRGIAKHE